MGGKPDGENWRPEASSLGLGSRERPAPVLTVRTLGPVAIRWGNRALEGTGLRKTEALLVYLALNPGPQDRSRLAGLLWGGLPESRARANLRHALWALRRELDASAFRSDRLSIGLSESVVLEVDALAFEAAIARADSYQRKDGRGGMVEHLEEAAALYQADFLIHFDVPDCAEFDEWIVRRRVWLRERALEALIYLMRYYTERGEYDQALRHTRHQLSLDPWREEAHRELMRLLALTGQRSAALEQYETCRQFLERELGLEPLEETVELYERLVRWEPGAFSDQDGRPEHVSAIRLPFAGREEEHAALVSLWDASRWGEGKFALIEGEAGVGKTRLAEEVVRYTEARGAVVLGGRCYEFGADVPYQPIAEALRACLSERAGDPRERGAWAEGGRGARRTSSRAISSAPPSFCTLAPVWLSELSRLLPELRQLVDELPEVTRIPGGAGRQRLFQAVARFLLELPRCTLFIDDLQWADQATLDLLHYLVHELKGAPIWVLGTYRPEEVGLSHPLTRLRQGLSRDHLVELLELSPLATQTVQNLAFFLVGQEEGVGFGSFLYRESEGNPLVLTEVVSDLQETGELRARKAPGGRALEEACWEWTGSSEAKVLPTTVRDVVLQRVGRLSEPARELLSLASVIGRQFDLTLLQAATARPEIAIREVVDEWLARRLVRMGSGVRLGSPEWTLSSVIAASTYDFSHDKIRVVVYDAVPLARRRSLHRRVVEVLEQRCEMSAAESFGLLAYHWRHAQEPTKAAEYHLRAGDQARLLYGHQEALDQYQQALAVFQEHGDHAGAARTLMKLGLTHHNAFHFQEARRAYDRGLALRRRTEGPQSVPTPLHVMGREPARTLRVRWVEPTTLDPAHVHDSDTGALLSHLFSGLVDLNPELDVVPDVAHAWELSEGGRRFIFHLRQDARWSDGRPVTARDFEYAWKRVLDPRTGSPRAGFLYDLLGARAFHRGQGARESVGVRACDDATLMVELERPAGYFLQLLTHVVFSPVPQLVVEDCDKDWTKERRFVANGPFLPEVRDQDGSLVLVRNPTYHGPFRGNVQRVVVYGIQDWRDRLAMYESDDLDVLGITYFPSEARERARRIHAGEYVSGPRLETCYLAFDVQRPPFDDVRVRQALAMATDRKLLAEQVCRSYASPGTGGLVPPGMGGHTAGIGLPYDPDRARQLLDQAGYGDGKGVPRVDVLAFEAAGLRGNQLSAQWRQALGVESSWEMLPWDAFLQRLEREPAQMVTLMWLADYPDPDNFLRVCRQRTWRGWQNETYDQLVEKARRVMDPKERMDLYARAEHLLTEEVPVLPLAYERDHLLIKPWVRHYPTSAIRPAFWKEVVIR